MKQMILILTAITILIQLTACNQQQNVKDQTKEKTSVTKPQEEKNAKETKEEKKETTNQKMIIKKREESTTKKQPNTDQSLAKATEKKVYQNAAFKNVMVTETNNNILITGKAQVFEGVFRYALSDGNHVIFNKRYQTVGAPTWGDFKISFKKNLITPEQTIFELFVYSAKDGSKENVLEIPLQAK